ncbi:GNAT family N-acetyltransferase [Aerococcaceae bacterium WGS1372]
MELVREGNAIVGRDENGKMLAEITFPQGSQEDVVIANHTFTDPSLRGRGIAGRLVDKMVEEMDKENKKIKATCPYVVRKFEENPDKYDFINADKHTR